MAATNYPQPVADYAEAVRRVEQMQARDTHEINLVSHWRKNGAENVNTHEFGNDLNLPHDLISPEQELQRVDVVYPVLIALMMQ